MKRLFDRAITSIYNGDFNNFNNFLAKLDGINFVDDDGRSLLFYAVLEDNMDALSLLIDKNVEVNIHDKEGWTPLHYAVNEHLFDIVKILLSSGANPNAKDNYGNTVIARAAFASKGRGEIIRLLLNNGADPSIENNAGMNALKLAEIIGNYNVKEFFKG